VISESVPTSALSFSAVEVSLCGELLVMLPDSTKRSHRYTQRLTDMYAVSCDLVQEDVVSLLRPPLTWLSVRTVG
jgi:hypothetical protein